MNGYYVQAFSPFLNFEFLLLNDAPYPSVTTSSPTFPFFL